MPSVYRRLSASGFSFADTKAGTTEAAQQKEVNVSCMVVKNDLLKNVLKGGCLVVSACKFAFATAICELTSSMNDVVPEKMKLVVSLITVFRKRPACFQVVHPSKSYLGDFIIVQTPYYHSFRGV